MNTITKSLNKINFKLYFSLLFLGLCPAIYNTVRVYFIGQLPDTWGYSIAGQLSWVNLIYEILNEAIILPLFFFIGEIIDNKQELTNRIKTGLIFTFVIYTFVSVLIIFNIDKLLNVMAVNTEILAQSASYIKIESIANIFSMLTSFALVSLITINKEKYIYTFTILRLILCLVLDTLLVSTLPISLNLGINGIGYSNIIVNIILFIMIIFMLSKEGINVIRNTQMSFAWISKFIKIGSISGFESFVRNIAYMLMIVRMVNVVNEQGTYWVANGFIWGWLLLPVLQLGELIKKEVATDKNAIKENTRGYFALTGIICVAWIVTMPLWKGFITNILGYADVDKCFNLVVILVGFYILFAFQNIFDATFYGLGKTNYMLFESVVTNSVYYGGAYILFMKGMWHPTLTSIALLFGIGIAFDSVVSLIAYKYMLKKENIRI